MIVNGVHRQPVGLDSSAHRGLKLQWPVTDWSPTREVNALFVGAGEFADACREFPLVFVRSGSDEQGQDEVAPIAVLGVLQKQNLFLTNDRWRGRYLPALLRLYPFCLARVDAERVALCVDMDYAGLKGDGGEALFTDQGQATPLLQQVHQQMEALDQEVQRTRLACRRLRELDLLRDMRFEATLPGGARHTVDGFLVVDEAKVRALPDAAVLELHRSGLLGLITLHWLSLRNMNTLLEWHVERQAA